ncbi:MAG: hypothetical protein MJK12_07170 [Colwellia sp.]|nr:hypothetical protein [Colwellia sp.]
MNPKICCSGLALITLLLCGCETDTLQRDEQADPVLVEYPVVYIQRDVIDDEDDQNPELARFSAFDPTIFNSGAALFYKKNAFTDSPSLDISASLFGENQKIDIRDLKVSDDGQQFLVAIRAPEVENVDDDQQAKWNIWLYQLATGQFERIIKSDIIAEQGDDLMASFLPDGRVIFASTRQRLSRAILLDEGKPQYSATNERNRDSAFNLHIMNADGTNINQLTFNLSHDFYPLVLQDGHILYSRWDAMGGNQQINLYRMNPDGSENELIYGWHSHQLSVDNENENIEWLKPQQLPNGDILLLLASNEETAYQKRPVIININDYIDQNQPVNGNTSQNSSLSKLFSENDIDFNFSEQLSLSGRISHLFPLPDNSERFLISWDLCRVIVDGLIRACGQLTDEEFNNQDLIAAEPLYELWLLNKQNNTQQLVAKSTEGKMLTEAIVMQPSNRPSTFIADKIIGNELDAELANQQSGAIHIHSVYDFDGQDISINENNSLGINQLKDPSLTLATQLPARFLRVIRGVPMPPREVRAVDNTDFGRSNNQLMREIIGYTPIQPDGSVKVKIPANVPLAISVLDENGQRIGGRHRQWITVRAGETLECLGCHTANSELPHGRREAQAPSINFGASVGGLPFPNTSALIVPEQGQTMAQADEMVNGLGQLSADIIYQDIWTNPQLSISNPEIAYRYSSLNSQSPNGAECYEQWNAYCRIQINYIEHIQPLWQLTREVFDVESQALLKDNTCVNCHQPLDKDNLAQIPAGQLNLSSSISADEPAHLTSYRELFFNDVEQEIIDGILVNKLIEVLDDNGNIVYEVDADGEFILDGQGNPIAVLTTVGVANILSTNSASSSGRFFELFNMLNSGAVNHQGMLTKHELKLLSEWLDIGAQYYNTPFYQQD